MSKPKLTKSCRAEKEEEEEYRLVCEVSNGCFVNIMSSLQYKMVVKPALKYRRDT